MELTKGLNPGESRLLHVSYLFLVFGTLQADLSMQCSDMQKEILRLELRVSEEHDPMATVYLKRLLTKPQAPLYDLYPDYCIVFKSIFFMLLIFSIG